MANKKIRLNLKAFIRDYIRGLPSKEIQREHALSDTGIMKVVSVLKGRGALAKTDLERRRLNLMSRVGGLKPGEAAENARKSVSVDLDAGLVLHCPTRTSSM
jgi:hypothetical protein